MNKVFKIALMFFLSGCDKVEEQKPVTPKIEVVDNKGSKPGLVSRSFRRKLLFGCWSWI